MISPQKKKKNYKNNSLIRDSSNNFLSLSLTTRLKEAEPDGKDTDFDLHQIIELVKIFTSWEEIWNLLIAMGKDDSLGK